MGATEQQMDRALAAAEARYLAAPVERKEEPETFDADTLADWIGGECFGCKPVPYARLLGDRTAADFAGWAVPDLLAVAFDQAQRASVRCAALEAIDAQFQKREVRK